MLNTGCHWRLWTVRTSAVLQPAGRMLPAIVLAVLTGCGAGGELPVETASAGGAGAETEQQAAADHDNPPEADAADQAPGRPAEPDGRDFARPPQANRGEVPPRGPLQNDGQVAELIERVEQSVVRIDVKMSNGSGIGSGFVVHSSGIVVTNHHVVEGCTSATVTFNDGTTAKVIGPLVLLPAKDIAVIRIETDGRKLQPLQLARNLPRKGENVVTLGAPHGLSFSISRGIVSAVRKAAEISSLGGDFDKDVMLVQTDASISPGNSGGPLVTYSGEVVGINTLGSVQGQSLNFAVSARDVAGAVQNVADLEVMTSFPPASTSGRKAASVGPAPTTAEVAAGLASHRQQWSAKQEQQIAELESEITDIQGELNATSLLVGTVRKGGRDALEVIKSVPRGSSRSEWLRATRAYQDTLNRKLASLQERTAFEETLLEKGLFAPPSLSLEAREVGRWGYVLGFGRVSQRLDADSFIAWFGDVQVHCRGFDSSRYVDGKLFAIARMCIASSMYQFTTVTGASRTILSIRPLDQKLLPEEYLDVRRQRQELSDARDERLREEWRSRVALSRTAVEEGIGFPVLKTQYEAKTIIDVLEGGSIQKPILPRRYRIETVQRVIPRTPPSPPLIVQTQKKVETDASKEWRKAEMRKFNERKSVFPAYALDSLIRELQHRALDSEQIYNRDSGFREDIDRLVQLAFGKYGIEMENRVQDIPWTSEDREAIVAQLRHIAIEFGELEPEVMDELARRDEADEEPETEPLAEQIESLEGKIRLQEILLGKSRPGEKDYVRRKADLRALQDKLADLVKEWQQRPNSDGKPMEN